MRQWWTHSSDLQLQWNSSVFLHIPPLWHHQHIGTKVTLPMCYSHPMPGCNKDANSGSFLGITVLLWQATLTWRHPISQNISRISVLHLSLLPPLPHRTQSCIDITIRGLWACSDSTFSLTDLFPINFLHLSTHVGVCLSED